MDAHALCCYLDKITRPKGDLHGLKKDILSVENIREHMRRTFNIDGTLFDNRVAISHLLERPKKEPTSQVFRMPMMGEVTLSRIAILTFDSSVLNWGPFREQF